MKPTLHKKDEEKMGNKTNALKDKPVEEQSGVDNFGQLLKGIMGVIQEGGHNYESAVLALEVCKSRIIQNLEFQAHQYLQAENMAKKETH